LNLAVIGLWHLGTVTSAVMAQAGHDVVALDEPAIVAALEEGRFPVAEPGLPQLWASQRSAGRLRTGTFADLADREVAWICYDTPLDSEDRPDIEFVRMRVLRAVEAMQRDGTILISSQLPVGTVRALAAEALRRNRGDLSFAVVPENLRLGSAIDYLRSPDRFVVGADDETTLARLGALLRPLGAPVEPMSIASAEMTKHALNAFLATSVAFSNEIASIAERLGADARDVERGLKTDARIGAKAYVRAGEAFAGGTLARDLAYLEQLGSQAGFEPLQIAATRLSNERHKAWLDDALRGALGTLEGARVALLGLVYKPGTDTLRASGAVAFARRLHAAGARLSAFDPAIVGSRAELEGLLMPAGSARDALFGADAVAVMTPWPEFRLLAADDWRAMRRRIVVDPLRFLEASSAQFEAYIAFGRPVDGTPA
jgi:UDPglucose 6-dehydrogenase